ncbi:MAG: hypothetical protein WC482_02315 [Candidatus Omnitrophota bacterium]
MDNRYKEENAGQIERGSFLGEDLYLLSRYKGFNTFLEIGTWNGRGSTKCFMDGLVARNDKSRLISIEADRSFFDSAGEFWKDNIPEKYREKLTLLWGRIVESEELFNERDIKEHNRNNPLRVERGWLNADREIYKHCPNVISKIPAGIDVLLLDGGEFSTYAEWRRLKETGPKIIILDDIRSLKARKIDKLMLEDERWSLIAGDPNDRNGWSIYKNNTVDLGRDFDVLHKRLHKFAYHVKLQESLIDYNEIIQPDKIKSFCDKNDIVYYKTDFLTKDGIWRGEKIKKLDFRGIRLLVTGHSDYEIDKRLFKLADKNLVKWYAPHVVYNDARLETITLGITDYCDDTPLHRIIGNTSVLWEIMNEKKNLNNLVYCNFTIANNVKERQKVWDIFNSLDWVTARMPDHTVAGHRSYLKNMHNHKFALCPSGNGVTCSSHRLWEALYLKTIPIVRRCYNHSFFSDLPVLLVDDWREILDKEFLEKKHEEMMSKRYNLAKLMLSYWCMELSGMKMIAARR